MTGQPFDIVTLPRAAGGRARGGRPIQQDELACLYDPREDTRLLVLADGMGGDGAGELAARGVVQTARKLWEQGDWRNQPGALFLEAFCQAAHDELRRLGRALKHGEPHSTVVALLMRGDRANWAHVGDSRLYRFRGRRLLGCTEDHSMAQQRARRGEISVTQLATAHDQHQLLRGLGGPNPPVVDHGCAMVRPGQSFALCSDGIWEHLSPAELGRFSRQRNQPQALRKALSLALERGGKNVDNMALIVVRAGWSLWFRQIGAKLSAIMPGN